MKRTRIFCAITLSALLASCASAPKSTDTASENAVPQSAQSLQQKAEPQKENVQAQNEAQVPPAANDAAPLLPERLQESAVDTQHAAVSPEETQSDELPVAADAPTADYDDIIVTPEVIEDDDTEIAYEAISPEDAELKNATDTADTGFYLQRPKEQPVFENPVAVSDESAAKNLPAEASPAAEAVEEQFVPPAVTAEVALALDNTPSQEELFQEETEAEEAQPEIKPSRAATVKKNQYLDVVYPGTGWVYVGETAEPKLFNYFGRKLGTGDTTFTLRAKTSGETMLHFYKSDPLSSTYFEDYIAVTVEKASVKGNSHVTAPAYANNALPVQVPLHSQKELARPVQPAKNKQQFADTPLSPERQESASYTVYEAAPFTIPKPAASSETGVAISEPIAYQYEAQFEERIDAAPADPFAGETFVSAQDAAADAADVFLASTDDAALADASDADYTNESQIDQEHALTDAEEAALLAKAQTAFKNKQYESALTLVQTYLVSASAKMDEALYLQGQILESESNVRNIRSAVDSYDTLTRRYPASKLWKQANKRSIYLKRFYIDIR